ncbi:MAG: uncharacterized protein QOF73_5455 [Thermomicrobiales bacterium]|nr:uncharacterized protein [Thermomicrobiales bacterium]
MKLSVWRAVLVGLICLLSTGGVDGVRAQDEETGYTSPSYGYGLTWDDSWEVAEESSEGGYDMIHLSNGVSDVWVEGYIGARGDPATCLEENRGYLADDGDPESVPYATDDEGTPIAGVENGVGFAVFDLTALGAEDDVPSVAIVWCQALRPGVSVLVVTQIVAMDDYEGQIEPVNDLLAGLTVPEETGAALTDTAELEEWETAVEEDLTAFWTEVFAAEGETYVAPEFVIFDAPIETACGDVAPEEVGPMYCPADQTVYLDQTMIVNEILPFGAFIVGTVIAHEIGHHIQDLLELEGCTDEGCGGRGGSLAVELQADCLSGVWAQHAGETGNVEAGDIENTIIGISAFFGDPPDTLPTDPSAHGPGALRTWWFLKGYYEQFDACLT